MNTLVVDLDGTLIKSDTTHELLVLCARWKPLLLFKIIFLLFFNKSAAKRSLAEQFSNLIEPADLPYTKEVLSLIHKYRAEGKNVELVSGTDQIVVAKIAEHLGLFNWYRGSEPGCNLTGKHKVKLLRERHGDNFAYVGNSRQDLAVWAKASKGYGVRAPSSAYTQRRGNTNNSNVEVLVHSSWSLKPPVKAMRPHQWAKNVLLFFVPSLFISSLSITDFFSLALAFISLGLMASGTYLLNDLFDIPDDRAHKTKRSRPLASADLSVPTGVGLMIVMIVTSLAIALLVGNDFFFVLIAYGVTTIAYSFRLKKIAILDVMILASLFTIRVVAGGAIIGHWPSSWLLCFVGFVFLSLAFAKRFVEVKRLANKGSVSGRGYQRGDEHFLLVFGGAASFAGVLALIVYGLLAETNVIKDPAIVLAIAILILGWLMRLWLIASRNQLNDDPVLFAVKDPPSLICLLIVAILVLHGSVDGGLAELVPTDFFETH